MAIRRGYENDYNYSASAATLKYYIVCQMQLKKFLLLEVCLHIISQEKIQAATICLHRCKHAPLKLRQG
jgi:hypothetical protein